MTREWDHLSKNSTFHYKSTSSSSCERISSTQKNYFCRGEGNPDGVRKQLQLGAVDGVGHLAVLLINVDALAAMRKVALFSHGTYIIISFIGDRPVRTTCVYLVVPGAEGGVSRDSLAPAHNFNLNRDSNPINFLGLVRDSRKYSLSLLSKGVNSNVL